MWRKHNLMAGVIAASVALGALMVIGCGAGGTIAGEGRTSSPTAVQSMPKIGNAFRYNDGLVITISAVERFEISQWAAGGTPGQTGLKVQVTAENGSPALINLSLTTLKISYGPDGKPADSVFDSEHGLTGGFSAQIPPSNVSQAWFGFAVDPGITGKLVVEVSPGFLDYRSVVFVGEMPA